MVTLRRTQTFLRRVEVSSKAETAPPMTVLGNWRANPLLTRPQQLGQPVDVEASREYPAPLLSVARRKCGKKADGAFLKRHRLKDGIPKEEEEKPRKQTVLEILLQCDSFC
jgi:hypothetical protein